MLLIVLQYRISSHVFVRIPELLVMKKFLTGRSYMGRGYSQSSELRGFLRMVFQSYNGVNLKSTNIAPEHVYHQRLQNLFSYVSTLRKSVTLLVLPK